MMKLVLVILISYLFGSVPWALVIGKVFYHKDIRKEGSGNPGATNAARVLGLPAGIAVTVLDALKGLISMLIAHQIAPGTEIYAGLACCIGHCFPLFAGFKGGKAVATSYGFLLGIAVLITHEYVWNFFLPVFCFFCFLFSTKMVSVSSMCSLLIETATSFILASMGRIEWNIPIALLILWVFVTYRHRENIVRIKNGTENKIGRKKE
ncbi:MAG: glycerol-3-phosphate 1-O-acyltransferase PlsY [Erysipelotrichaceae bacterium]|nr:glycerol-3-phosphate 1-O-acyltransferase PlsY [Erysipelotrichaceae bacterium]